jgi:hypothetical protein
MAMSLPPVSALSSTFELTAMQKVSCVAKKGLSQLLMLSLVVSLEQVQELEANAARQQKQVEALTAGLQKVSAQLEMNESAPQTVQNDR